MKVILQESYMNLGEAGDIVAVRPGYARNFLIPQKLAVSATPQNIRLFEDRSKELEAKKLAERSKAEQLTEKLKDLSLSIIKKVGDDGKLYGSVSAQDVSNTLKEEGLEVDRRMIVLGQQIKLLGEYEIMIKLVGGKRVNLPLSIVAEKSAKDIEEQEAAKEEETN